MIGTALNPSRRRAPQLSAAVARRGRRPSHLRARGTHRATWQSWHLYAEAQRQVRDLDVPAEQVAEVVEHLVDAVTTRLINLTPDLDPITEPAALRRSDGDQRLPAHRRRPLHQPADAGRRAAHRRRRRHASAPRHHRPARRRARADEGRRSTEPALNEGQHELVRAMVSDPRQVALALAPAGPGKTTAMSVLAPTSATTSGTTSSASPRRRQPPRSSARRPGCRPRRSPSSTTPSPPGLDPGIGPRTVIVIDEAGMADTPTLDRSHRRLLRPRRAGPADRRRPAARRDRRRRSPARHRHHPRRRTTRGGRPVRRPRRSSRVPRPAGRRPSRARVLPRPRPRPQRRRATPASTEVLGAWLTERAAGRECLMLAPTRDLVARLNQAARTARLGGAHPCRRGRSWPTGTRPASATSS